MRRDPRQARLDFWSLSAGLPVFPPTGLPAFRSSDSPERPTLPKAEKNLKPAGGGVTLNDLTSLDESTAKVIFGAIEELKSRCMIGHGLPYRKSVFVAATH